MTEPDSEFIGVVRGLFFEGYLLTYNPMYNITEWVPVRGMVGDLSPTEDSLLQELILHFLTCQTTSRSLESAK